MTTGDMKEKEVLVSVVGAMIATLCASFFSYSILQAENSPMILASTGASAMLIFGVPHAKVSAPWNLVVGHIVSAFVGVTCAKFIVNPIIASSLAIGVSMQLMYWAKCVHPPGGATAVTAVIGGSVVTDLGYAFLIIPVFFNAIILLSFAMAVGTFREKNPFEISGTLDTKHSESEKSDSTSDPEH